LRSPDVHPLRLANEGDPGRGAVTPARRVDDLDRKIIEALQANGRESFRRIAASVGVSEATVRARYARLTSEGAYNATPSWSPKGDMIAYVSRFEGRFDLFVYKLGEGKAYQITTGVGTSESPSWSPDGRALVFNSNRSGAMQLYWTSLDGRQVDQVSPLAPVQSPRWVQ